MPTITVIVPIYNVEPYLRRCVDSILAQTFTGFELVLVDDGSPDNCGAICDEYAEKDARIRVIHQENGGLSAARNAGIDWAFANSNSKWLAFVDSDDWVHPRYLELLYSAVQTDHIKLSACEIVEVEKPTPAEEVVPETELLPWDDYLQRSWCIHSPCNKLYVKELFEGMRYPVGKLHEDAFLTYKLLIRAETISYLPMVLYYYYHNPQGIMNSPFSLKRLDSMDAYEERIEYVKSIKSTKALAFSVRDYLSHCMYIVDLLRAEEHIPAEVRKEKEREIKQRCRVVIFRYGLRYAPPWEYGYLYRFAFPGLHGVGKAVVKPGMKMLKIGKYKDF
ncbi:MAG: glycosyltransferase [Oscillospiraceae bacterium]|nr:glycosyltransferase [Oscillospiraceae bacterium]